MKKSWLWTSVALPAMGFRLPVAASDSDHKVIADIAKYGWHVVHIPEDEVGPGYSFTIGLYYTFRHPELVIFGLSQNVSHDIFSASVEIISKGTSFRAGDHTDALLEGNDCRFNKVAKANYKEYLGSTIWFYRSMSRRFPALQILWPDKSGKFPGEDGFNESLSRLQLII